MSPAMREVFFMDEVIALVAIVGILTFVLGVAGVLLEGWLA